MSFERLCNFTGSNIENIDDAIDGTGCYVLAIGTL